VRKYGFIFVDGNGQPTEKARKDTYYALHPEESKVMALAYERIVSDGCRSTRCASTWSKPGSTRRDAKHWHTATLGELIRDPIYKGEFNANRFYFERTTNLETSKSPCSNVSARATSGLGCQYRRLSRPKSGNWLRR